MIAAVVGYTPLEKEDSNGCFDDLPPGLAHRPSEMTENWTEIEWNGDWYDLPSWGEIEDWVFDSVCQSPDDNDVEPDAPESWLSILGLI